MTTLQQIILDGYIDPELLEELSDEQKAILFFKMRQVINLNGSLFHSIRRFRILTPLGKVTILQVTDSCYHKG
jgi:hypothetical protein